MPACGGWPPCSASPPARRSAGRSPQAFGWRSIFLLQVPAALAALPAVLAAGPARQPAPVGSAERWPLGPVVALALASGAIAAALFLTVLLLIAGWGIDPLLAAAAVSIMPLTALAVARVEAGPPALRAGGGCLLLAAGTAALAFLPTASVAWTVVPQLAIGVGMGLSLPALAGTSAPGEDRPRRRPAAVDPPRGHRPRAADAGPHRPARAGRHAGRDARAGRGAGARRAA